jgi:2-polyprenyl-6-methoxyphenol hydroxylase-like FAD-dependent oxidoreductase
MIRKEDENTRPLNPMTAVNGTADTGSGQGPSPAGRMHEVDIAIVGAGLSGSIAALLLGRSGYRVALIDIHGVYPPDFRCEKFANEQLDLLSGLGLFDSMTAMTTPAPEMFVARFGRLVERTGKPEYGFYYEKVVNAVRAQLPAEVSFITGRVAHIGTGTDIQRVTLSNGDTVTARLIVLASGLGDALRQGLGIQRHVIRDKHSLTIGFDVAPAPGEVFEFPALTYYGENASERMAYVSFFPIGDVMRVNLFCYRAHDGEWARAFRDAPRETLFAVMPGLRKFVGDFQVIGKVKLRVVDLFSVTNFRRDGVVLIGDSFQSTCPAAGNGVTRVLTDVGQLCNVHVPRWFASPGMAESKISEFYDDQVKLTCDLRAAQAAEYCRSFTIDQGPLWRARRWRAYLRPRLRAHIGRRTAPKPALENHATISTRTRRATPVA